MVLNGCVAPSSIAIKLAPTNGMHNTSSIHTSKVHASVAFPASMVLPKLKSPSATYHERKILALRGGSTLNFSGTASPLVRGDCGGGVARMMPLFPSSGKVRPRPRTSMIATSSKKFSAPPMTHKPRWWWRTTACVPYLLPLHEAWMYADNVFKLHFFLEKFEFLVDPFMDTLALLPNWFTMVVMYVVYLGVVRRKELPHFLRFHLLMAMLMSLALQLMATVAGWMPGMVFKGRMAYLWIAVALVEMFTVVRCMLCSLRGMYADVPFMSDAAYINLSM